VSPVYPRIGVDEKQVFAPCSSGSGVSSSSDLASINRDDPRTSLLRDFRRRIRRCIISHDDFERLRRTSGRSANRCEGQGQLCFFVVRGNDK
jgi:hypothetical protein